ncbi:hypothetical protein C1645_832034 [Glomus cerebriforme]|uniref:Uncharacterized protein n=1 Tax=Glomus cerebriforme TaxID=658196 RepID=A0A397SKV6_9GLOM|nr:hypothetical protein C1645_832034 [Glomus cerebriforme]
MDAMDPTSRLLKGPNIWNICIIDNIDFKGKTFTYYDTCSSSHATLRLSIDSACSENSEIEFSHIADIETINKKIIDAYNINFKYAPAHVVILEAGGNPNKIQNFYEN